MGARVGGANYAGGKWQGGKWQGGKWAGGKWHGGKWHGKWHGRYWPYWAAGVGIGYAAWPYYGGYYCDEYDPYCSGYPGDAYYQDGGYVEGGYDDGVAYCIRRFRTYDVESGTYVGKGGRRIACP